MRKNGEEFSTRTWSGRSPTHSGSQQPTPSQSNTSVKSRKPSFGINGTSTNKPRFVNNGNKYVYNRLFICIIVILSVK